MYGSHDPDYEDWEILGDTDLDSDEEGNTTDTDGGSSSDGSESTDDLSTGTDSDDSYTSSDVRRLTFLHCCTHTNLSGCPTVG